MEMTKRKQRSDGVCDGVNDGVTEQTTESRSRRWSHGAVNYQSTERSNGKATEWRSSQRSDGVVNYQSTERSNRVPECRRWGGKYFWVVEAEQSDGVTEWRSRRRNDGGFDYWLVEQSNGVAGFGVRSWVSSNRSPAIFRWHWWPPNPCQVSRHP
jgi:hypothetical protein